jgi:glycosyltransferase involved in cell wall biosynthesis
VQRKGVVWFIENVVNRLDRDITYIIAGEGREKSAILTAINENNLQNRVLYVGGVSDNDKQLLFCSADLFVQPNIRVEGDLEGFGLVVLEAAAHGLVVIASDIEGLKDAIQDGQNGFLVTAGDADAYQQKIQEVLQNPAEKEAFSRKARVYTNNNNTWPEIARKYLGVMRSISHKQPT